MKKRLLSLIVAAACLISCLPGVCFAAPAQNQGREEASAAGAETKASSGKKVMQGIFKLTVNMFLKFPKQSLIQLLFCQCRL